SGLSNRIRPSPVRPRSRRCRRASSRWETSAAGTRFRTRSMGPRGPGHRSSPRRRKGTESMSRTATAPAPADLLLPGARLSYLGVMVVLPMLAIGLDAARPGLAAFWSAVSEPFAWHALKLTFSTALIMVIIDAVLGTATAWVLVRHDFPGKGLV